MSGLTDHGTQVRDDLAQRYDVSGQAVEQMMAAVLRGGGTQAQFDIPELGGMGQWSWGGMTMVGDMFNTGLQATVSGLCGDIAQAASTGALFHKAAPARSWQGQAQSQGTGLGGHMGLGMSSGWWPDELGQPSSLGSQNDLSYAIFPDKQRLAVNLAGRVTVYDTGPHEIGGISQQQSGLGSWVFASQYGNVDLSRLKVVPPADRDDVDEGAPEDGEVTVRAGAVPDVAVEAPMKAGVEESVAAPSPEPVAEPAKTAAETQVEDTPREASPVTTPSPKGLAQTADEIIAALEKLGSLRDIGILTDDEFAAKKADLLSRL